MMKKKTIRRLSKNSVICNLHIKGPSEQQENPSKIIQMIILLIISNLGWLVLFCIICRTQICRLCLKTRSQQFLNKSMLESAQQTKKIDLNYYVINHQWFMVTSVILRNLKSKNWLIFPTKTPPGYLVKINKKKKEVKKKKFKTFLLACTWNFMWISLNCVISSYLKFEIDYL